VLNVIKSFNLSTNECTIISHKTLLKHFKTLRHVSILSDHHQGALFLAKVILRYTQFNSCLQSRCCGSISCCVGICCGVVARCASYNKIYVIKSSKFLWKNETFLLPAENLKTYRQGHCFFHLFRILYGNFLKYRIIFVWLFGSWSHKRVTLHSRIKVFVYPCSEL